jgi:hypothetical protein
VIRIRRIKPRLWLGRVYEIETDPVDPSTSRQRRVTRAPVRLLGPLVGVGDAWSLRDAADRAWAEGNTGWAVEFEDHAE